MKFAVFDKCRELIAPLNTDGASKYILKSLVSELLIEQLRGVNLTIAAVENRASSFCDQVEVSIACELDLHGLFATD